jgi:magnesium-transporting ATPase (P-type)
VTPVDVVEPAPSGTPAEADERRGLEELFRDLRTGPEGLTGRDATRRLSTYGPNSLPPGGGPRYLRELLKQFTQPLAVLLLVAAALAWIGHTPTLAIAVLAVVVLNAAFAFVQEVQAERAVDALAAFLPATARVQRDGVRVDVAATDVVPGDLLIVTEGDRICADARIVGG